MNERYEVLCVFPFALEAKPLLKKAESLADELWAKDKILFASCGQGSLKASALITHLLTVNPSVKKVILVGSAGALHPACPEWIWVQECFEADFSPARTWTGYLANTTSAKDGKILSINQNIDTKEHREQWYEMTSCDAVAWESAALPLAAQFLNVAFAELRFVTDFDSIPDFKAFKKIVVEKSQKLPQILESFF